MDTVSLYNIAESISGKVSAQVGFTTTVKIPKSLGFGKVTKKVSIGKATFNVGYAELVEDVLMKNGVTAEVKEGELPWGSWELSSKVIAHNGEHYLRIYIQYKDADISSDYFVDGRRANAAEESVIRGWEESKRKADKKQSAFGIPADEQVRTLDIAFSHMDYFKAAGQVWALDDYEGMFSSAV